MCAEFWVGWFDHWGNGGHMKSNLEENVQDFDRMLELGNVNIYMFQGGTNFGFMKVRIIMMSLLLMSHRMIMMLS